MNEPLFQVFRSASNNEYYYRLRSRNNEIILHGEGYTTKQSCLSGIASVKTNAPLEEHYDRRDKVKNFTFNLKAGNGEIIGRSENYVAAAGRENGIAAVKQDAPRAPVADLT